MNTESALFLIKKFQVLFLVPGKAFANQSLICWIILIGKRLCLRREKLLVIVASMMLIIIIGMIFYVVLGSLFEEKVYTEPKINYGHRLGNHTIYYKDEWRGIRYTRKVKMKGPVGLVIISHTDSKPCASLETCGDVLRRVQTIHMNRGLLDIGFNFAIGGDGNIYVGRGWDVYNCHSRSSIGISFIGNYNIDTLDDNMIDAAQSLILQGLSLKKILDDYYLIGQNQSSRAVRNSPGGNVCREIRKWNHYSSMIIYPQNLLKLFVQFFRPGLISCDYV